MTKAKAPSPTSLVPSPASEFVLYQTDDGATRIECRFDNETVWLTQALVAELFQVTVPTVNEHLKDIFAEGELAAQATIRKFRIVRTGSRPTHNLLTEESPTTSHHRPSSHTA